MYYKPINMATPKWNQFESTEKLYNDLVLALWDRLSDSKKHKAYYLFSVLFSEAYYLENNVSMVRDAVRNNTLNLIREGCHPDDKYDDNIVIYFLDEGKGQFFIVLLFKPHSYTEQDAVLDIIPVKRNDYEMTQIYPIQKVPKSNSSNLQRN
jgi:hypothetical protein